MLESELYQLTAVGGPRYLPRTVNTAAHEALVLTCCFEPDSGVARCYPRRRRDPMLYCAFWDSGTCNRVRLLHSIASRVYRVAYRRTAHCASLAALF